MKKKNQLEQNHFGQCLTCEDTKFTITTMEGEKFTIYIDIYGGVGIEVRHLVEMSVIYVKYQIFN